MGRPSANLDGLGGKATRSGHRIPGNRARQWRQPSELDWVYLYGATACVMCELLHLLLMQFINYLAERPAGCHC